MKLSAIVQETELRRKKLHFGRIEIAIGILRFAMCELFYCGENMWI